MLVAKQSADLLTENPHIDEVIPFDRKAGNKDTGEMRRIIRLLRKRRFDLAIDFQRKFRTSLLAYAERCDVSCWVSSTEWGVVYRPCARPQHQGYPGRSDFLSARYRSLL